MADRTRKYVCSGIAILLIVGGTVATGVFPSTAIYQILAGGIIVVGFAVFYLCFGGADLFE